MRNASQELHRSAWLREELWNHEKQHNKQQRCRPASRASDKAEPAMPAEEWQSANSIVWLERRSAAKRERTGKSVTDWMKRYLILTGNATPHRKKNSTLEYETCTMYMSCTWLVNKRLPIRSLRRSWSPEAFKRFKTTKKWIIHSQFFHFTMQLLVGIHLA